jgi:hypothetical protein
MTPPPPPVPPFSFRLAYVKGRPGGRGRASVVVMHHHIRRLPTHNHTAHTLYNHLISSSIAVVVFPNMNVLLIPYGLRPARTTALRQLAQNHSRSYHLAPTTSLRFRTGAAATNPVGRSLSLRSTLIRLGPTRANNSVLGTLRPYSSSPTPLPPTPAQQAS